MNLSLKRTDPSGSIEINSGSYCLLGTNVIGKKPAQLFCLIIGGGGGGGEVLLVWECVSQPCTTIQSILSLDSIIATSHFCCQNYSSLPDYLPDVNSKTCLSAAMIIMNHPFDEYEFHEYETRDEWKLFYNWILSCDLFIFHGEGCFKKTLSGIS